MSKQLTAQVFAVMYNARTVDNNQLLGPNSDDHNILNFLADQYTGLYNKVSALDSTNYKQFIDDIFTLHSKYFPRDFA